MTLKKKGCDVQCHPTADGFLSNFEFSDFEVHRMSLCLKLSDPENFQIVLVPAILEGQVEVLAILSLLRF